MSDSTTERFLDSLGMGRNGRPSAEQPAGGSQREPVGELERKPGSGVTVDQVIDAVRGYMDVRPDEVAHLIVALAVAVSKRLDGEEPLWVLLVGQSGGGKTEAIRLLHHVADKQVDELTRAGLLSWSQGKQRRRTGLLTQIPRVALVTISDFSTVVTMGDREARARMFGMLRVVYDGRVYRSIGGESTGGSDPLEWEGHLTLLAASTAVIDSHLAFEAALGERFLLFRLPEHDAGRVRQRTVFSVRRDEVPEFRAEAQRHAAVLVEQARERIPARLSEQAEERLVDAAVFVAHARTGVEFEGTGKHRVPVGYPMPEEPMRLAGQIVRLCRCLIALGLSEELAVRIAGKAALDSVPIARLRALRHVCEEEGATVSSVHDAIGRGDRYGAKWQLAALQAIGMVQAHGPDEDEDPKAIRTFTLKSELRGVYESVGSFFSPLSL